MNVSDRKYIYIFIMQRYRQYYRTQKQKPTYIDLTLLCRIAKSQISSEYMGHLHTKFAFYMGTECILSECLLVGYEYKL